MWKNYAMVLLTQFFFIQSFAQMRIKRNKTLTYIVGFFYILMSGKKESSNFFGYSTKCYSLSRPALQSSLHNWWKNQNWFQQNFCLDLYNSLFSTNQNWWRYLGWGNVFNFQGWVVWLQKCQLSYQGWITSQGILQQKFSLIGKLFLFAFKFQKKALFGLKISFF